MAIETKNKNIETRIFTQKSGDKTVNFEINFDEKYKTSLKDYLNCFEALIAEIKQELAEPK